MGDWKKTTVAVVYVYLIFGLCLVAGYRVGTVCFQQSAIARGYALHCPQTGDFAWKGECE